MKCGLSRRHAVLLPLGSRRSHAAITWVQLRPADFMGSVAPDAFPCHRISGRTPNAKFRSAQPASLQAGQKATDDREEAPRDRPAPVVAGDKGWAPGPAACWTFPELSHHGRGAHGLVHRSGLRLGGRLGIQARPLLEFREHAVHALRHQAASCDCSRSTPQGMSGRSSSQVTISVGSPNSAAFALVARSIAGQCSAGTRRSVLNHGHTLRRSGKSSIDARAAWPPSTSATFRSATLGS